jgi:quercetin dioxygenase-like cupin family protein
LAKPGDALENPITGERMVFRKVSKDTNGQLMQSDFFMRPHSKGVATVEHVQPGLEQRLEVISGEMSYTLGKSKERKVARAGEIVIIPAKVPHSIWNDAEEELHALDEYEPAFNIEKFFETAYGLAKRQGKVQQEDRRAESFSAVGDDAGVQARNWCRSWGSKDYGGSSGDNCPNCEESWL